MSPTPDVAPRYRVSTYWWIATEIVRRNPKLELVETYPMDGFYDCLTLFGEQGGRKVHIDLNRLGSIHIHPDHIHHMEDREVLAHQDAHWAIKEIERVAGLTPADTAPASNSRIITLRILARALNYLVNDKSSWDVRMLDHHGLDLTAPLAPTIFEPKAGSHPFPNVFPTAYHFEAFAISSDLPHSYEPGRLWTLLRDESPVAVFDTKGVVHTRECRIALKPLYARMNRNLTQTMAHALGELLP